MKDISRCAVTIGLAMLMTCLGCFSTRQIKTAKELETVDTAPGQSTKGYVEFTALSKNAVVPILLFDNHRSPHLLAATGLRKGERYSFSRHQTTVAETVRVSLPPGSHTFMIERDGEIVRVPVEAGKVTPVQIDYVPIHTGSTLVVYRVKAQVGGPVPFEEKPPKS